jgi:hypothetical protein
VSDSDRCAPYRASFNSGRTTDLNGKPCAAVVVTCQHNHFFARVPVKEWAGSWYASTVKVIDGSWSGRPR